MAIFKATATFQGVTDLPEDRFVNTFHFNGGGGDTDNVFDMVYDFYNKVGAGATASIKEWFTTAAVRAWVDLKLYDLADPEPRVPVAFERRAFTGMATTEQLPNEVALVASFQGAPASGVPAARRRNRVYVGPFAIGATEAGRPIDSTKASLVGAMKDMQAASAASTSWSWVAYSPTLGSGTPVTNGWVDNAWDTQRRRGLASTVRSLWNG